MILRVISVEDWAEIRRLHRAEGVSVSEVARRLGISRNTVRAALASDRRPQYERALRPTLADGIEAQVRALLVEFPRMPATVIAQRIGWTHSLTTLKDRLRQIRPEYVGIDPVDRVVYQPGEIAQCDLWFPETPVPVAAGQQRILPGAGDDVGVLPVPDRDDAALAPRRGPALGHAGLISGLGRVTKTLVWDARRRSVAPGSSRLRRRRSPARSPRRSSWPRPGIRSSKAWSSATTGSSRPRSCRGRRFASPADFNDQWIRRSAWCIGSGWGGTTTCASTPTTTRSTRG